MIHVAKSHLIGFLISGVFLTVGILTLSSYGLNEDSIGHFVRGQDYLLKLTTSKELFNQPNLPSPFLFIPGQRISEYKLSVYEAQLAPIKPVQTFPDNLTAQQAFSNYQGIYGRQSIFKSNPWGYSYQLENDSGHPPLSDILEAVSNRIFYELLGITGDIEGYYMYVVALASVLLFGVYLFVKKTYGNISAVIAAISLALFPIFFAESHFNLKDIPELTFFAASVISFYYWVTTSKNKWFAIFTLAFFAGFATKFNIVFFPFVILPWLIIVRKEEFFKNWFNYKLLAYLLIFGFFQIMMLYLVWPFLWQNPIANILEVLNFYQQTGTTDLSVQVPSPYLLPFGIDLRGVLLILATTPLIILFLFVAGLFFLIKKSKKDSKRTLWLVFFWFAAPVLRILSPGADIFDSTRQYMEYIPALAILAGIGGEFLLRKLSNTSFLRSTLKVKLPAISVIVILIYTSYLAFVNISFHPNQNVYANSMFGSTRGAYSLGLFGWQSSYGNPYKQASIWLNKNAEPNAKLAYLDGTMLGISPIWLRNDIHFGTYFSAFDQKGEYIASIVYPDPPKVFAYNYLENFLKPVYEINVGGQVIFKIWKNDKFHLKPGFDNFTKINVPSKKEGQDNLGKYFQLDFDRDYEIVRVTIMPGQKNCSKNDGLFDLSGYFVPKKVQVKDEVLEFLFAGNKTHYLRFYELVPNSCLFAGEISSIEVLK